MNADLLAMLGGTGVPGSSPSARRNEGKTILTFKAGKMTTTLQPNGKHLVSPDHRRGQISLVYQNHASALKFEWRDRRTRALVDDLTLPEDASLGRIAGQRAFVLTYGEAFRFYWPQDAVGGDEAVLGEFNSFARDRKACKKAAGFEEEEEEEREEPVDALSNILENLGMPRAVEEGTGQLTLADLQGAMAGLATEPAVTPPLQELLSPTLVDESGILEDEAAVERLLELLPEGQRTRADLMENLRSPQVLDSLKSLTSVLVGGGEGLGMVIANFGLEAGEGNGLGNPVQLFLDSVRESVEKEKEEKETKEEGEEKMDETKQD